MPMTRYCKTVAMAILVGSSLASQSVAKRPVKVVTTLNVLASVAKEIGGVNISVEVLCSPRQDPHHLVAKPTFKAAAQKADLFVELGLDLDKWAKAVCDSSGNPLIQLGAKGRVIASRGIRTKELPETLSKSWGDIHPYGNPHVWLDPVNLKQVASNIEAGLRAVDPGRKEIYQKGLAAFQHKIDVALFGETLLEEFGASKLVRLANRGRLISYLERKQALDQLGGWLGRAESLRGLKIVTYHKTWIYFCERFGLDTRAEIEEKPGIPPSQTYLDKLIGTINEEEIKVLFIPSFYPVNEGRYIAKKTGARVVSGSIDVDFGGGSDYFMFIDDLIDRILKVAG